MTKMIKMSLIAAVAVTGITSTLSAQPLEEAIKGVDVSGMLRYRYDDAVNTGTNQDLKNDSVDGRASTQTNEYTMQLNVKSKVNDAVTANVKIEALGVTLNNDVLNTNQAHATNDAVGDRDVNLVVTKANFEANLGVATVIAGKQSVPSPFVDNSSDDSTRGTGAVALIPVAGMTVAAGHFVNFQHASEKLLGASVNSGSSINALALLGKVSNVSFDAWYVTVDGRSANVTGLKTDVTGTSIGANTTIADINIDARWSKVARDTLDDSGLTKIVASTKIGAANVVAGIAMTPKDNINATIDTDNDAKSGFRLWQASTETLNDSTAFLIGAGMDVMPNLNLDAKYVTASATAATKDLSATELLLNATYKMSKNLAINVRYSMYEVDADAVAGTDIDSDKGRLEVKYTF